MNAAGNVTRLSAAVLVAAAAFSIASPAGAALFDDNEARARVDATNRRIDDVRKVLDERIAALESQNRSAALADMVTQIEQLRGDLAKVRGQLEVITYELAEAQKRQRDLYVDLDSRLRRIESAPPPSAPSGAVAPDNASASINAGGTPGFGPAPSATAAGAGAGAGAGAPRAAGGDNPTEQRAYDAALDLFKAGNYGAAVQSFAGFMRAYPRSPLAPSAQYWLGNAQFALHDFRAAITSQRQLIASYPDSSKVPDALLNIASSQVELGDGPAARRTLEDIVARYPQSDAAGKARQRLAAAEPAPRRAPAR